MPAVAPPGSDDSVSRFRLFSELGRLCLPLLLVGCLPTGAGSYSQRLVVTGSSTVAPLAAEMAARFEQLHPQIRVDVQTGGSGKGIADVRAGVADIGMASRDLKEAENDLQSHQIAVDGVGFIVNAGNSLAQISRSQVLQIYRKKVSNWRQLGGADQPIVVVHKAEGRATLEVFLKHFELQNSDVQADVIVGDNEHAVKTVAQIPGAVGYVSIGTAIADAAAGVSIRLLPLDGVPASIETVAAGSFPLSRPLHLVTSPTPGEAVTRFIKFCQSKQVHDIVIAQHFVPPSK